MVKVAGQLGVTLLETEFVIGGGEELLGVLGDWL